ncbi:hypothetical protein [Herbidospora sp. RD11066]
MRHTWIGQPLTVLALVVLVVNDHLLKATFPGFVTGKLSDVAGLVLLPPLLDLLVRRPRLSIAITGAGFTLVKTTATGAWLASEAWSLVWNPSVVLADPTDLLALPALWVAWWAYTHPVSVHRAVVFLVVPPAVLAVAATAAPVEFTPYSALSAVADGEEILVHVQGGYSGYTASNAYRTIDGLTWRGESHLDAAPPRGRACHGGACYRIVPGRLRLEQSSGGPWTTAWEITDEQYDRLGRARGGPEPRRPTSRAVAVTARLVVVVNGDDGIAVRDATGAWRRLGLGPGGFKADLAPSLSEPGRYNVEGYVWSAAIAAALLALMAFTLEWKFLLAAFTLGLGALLGMAAAEGLLIIGVLVQALVLLPGFVIFLAALVLVRMPWWQLAGSAVAGALAWAAVAVPHAAWSAGHIGFYADAERLAIAGFVVVAVAGTVAAYLTGAVHRRSHDPVPK